MTPSAHAGETVDLGAPLVSLDLVPVKVGLPRPAELALEQLVVDLMARARELGKVSRGELVGALLLRALERRDDLPRDLQEFRRAEVHEILLNKPGTSGLMEIPPRMRGRPRRRA